MAASIFAYHAGSGMTSGLRPVIASATVRVHLRPGELVRAADGIDFADVFGFWRRSTKARARL